VALASPAVLLAIYSGAFLTSRSCTANTDVSIYYWLAVVVAGVAPIVGLMGLRFRPAWAWWICLILSPFVAFAALIFTFIAGDTSGNCGGF